MRVRMATSEFLSELSTMPLTGLADVLERYVQQVGANDMTGYAQALSAAVWGALPKDETQDEAPRLLSIADFYDSVGEPPPALVAEVLPANKLVAFSGMAKQGKSLVALDIMDSISRGQQLMGQFDVLAAGPVAYFGMEDGGHEIKSRLMQRGVSPQNANFYVCAQPFDLAKPEGFETFKQLVSSMPEAPSLVVIDTAREGFALKDWNDASQVSAAISPLRRWAQKHCTVLLVVHNNKDKAAVGANKISGSTALVSSCDSYMILENKIVLETGDLQWDWEMAGRGVKSTKYMLVMDTHTLHVRVLGAGEAEAAKSEERSHERKVWYGKVGRYLYESENYRATIKQIMDAVDAKYDFALSIIKEMMADGTAAKSNEMMPQPLGRPAPMYEVTEKGIKTYLLGGPALDKTAQQVSPDTETSSADAGDDDTEEI